SEEGVLYDANEAAPLVQVTVVNKTESYLLPSTE
ncbi:unnamed protein product, partial [marine sediment metagenome]